MRSAAALIVLLVLPAVAAAAVPAHVKATLNVAGIRYPPKPVGNVAAAKGSYSETVDTARAVSSWRLTFSGTTGPVREARVVYWEKDAKTGITVTNNMELCHPCRSGATGASHWPLPRYASGYLASVRHGVAWVFVYTAKNPKGEIAGTVKLAP
jgi:hypothetical protein